MQPNAEQRINLKKLADYLATGVTAMKFDMDYYCTHQDSHGHVFREVNPNEHTCGTVACAAGHGPSAGIPAAGAEHWGAYIERVFGVMAGSTSWEFMFGSDWGDVDNTPEGAAKRINWFLEHGAPDEDLIEDMQNDIEPLCYETPA